MKKALLLITILIFCSFCISQVEDSRKRKEVLKEYGLKRNSLEVFALGGFTRSTKQIINVSPLGTSYSQKVIGFYDLHFGPAIRFSSNWYITPENKNRWYFRTNWIMGGIVWVDGILFPSAPINVGIGDNIKFSNNLNFDFSISGGLVLIGPGYLSDYVEPIFAVYPEVKIQTKWLTIGLIYSRNVERYKAGKSIYHTLFIGLSRGIR